MDTLRSPIRYEPAARSARLHPRRAAMWTRALREAGIVTLAALLYFFVRGLMETRTDQAMANADWLIRLERALGLFHEQAMQAWVLQFDWLVTFANRFYIFGHWPVIAGTLVWLLWRHREHVALYRSALLLSGAIGLVFFVTMPMSPPRFLTDLGFVDTVTHGTNAYRVLQPPSFTNPYAAMPSLHVGWNLLMGIAIWRHATGRAGRTFGLVMPIVMWLATIVTANHFILDGVVGSLVALAGLALAWRLSRSRSPRPVAELPVAVVPQPTVLGQGWARKRAA